MYLFSCLMRCVFLFILVLGHAKEIEAQSSSRYFPSGQLHATWNTFEVAGYKKPITGVIYRGNPRPTCGMPLGGIDTGCIDIESNGMLGYSTLFNHLIYPEG